VNGGANVGTVMIVLILAFVAIFLYMQYLEQQRQARSRTLGGGIGQLGAGIGTIVDSVYVGGS